MESTPEQIAEGESVVRVLAAVLERLIGANSLLAQTDPGKVTKFHALKAPGIAIHQYLERIHKYASCSTECFVLALIYIDRLIQRNNFLLTDLNVHRVVITAVLLAAKFFDDAYYNNAYYAKVGGVLISEMNSLEVEFLFRINFSLHVDSEVFQKYRAELAVHAGENQQPLAAAGIAAGGGSSQFLPDTFQVHQAPAHIHQGTLSNNALAPFQTQQQPTMVPPHHVQQQQVLVPLPTITTHASVPLAHHNHQVPMIQQNAHHTVPINPQSDYIGVGQQQQHLHHKHQIPIPTQANGLYSNGPPQTNTGTNNAYGIYGGNAMHMPQHPSTSSVVVGGSSEHFVHATASASGFRR